MLIDFIQAENLPHWLVWIDWNFYAHKTSLLLFIAGAVGIWMLWCLVKYGVGVG